MGPNDLFVNLLSQASYLTYAKDPARFHAEVLHHFQKVGPSLCVVDEIQKLPSLLDDVHDLIETTAMVFLLTGSSARKLRRGSSNLLAGRAFYKQMFPLLASEIGSDFQLERALQYGLLPKIWNGDLEMKQDQEEFLIAYCSNYLKEEIQEEGVVRKLAPFARFLDIAASSDGELVSFSSVARDCGVSVKTAQEYYQILEDTLVAWRLDPWKKSVRKRLVSHPKYYFFDPGVTNSFYQNWKLTPGMRGRRFEQFFFLQLLCLNSYQRLGFHFYFWRSSQGAEVDFILEREGKPQFALEIKSSSTLQSRDLSGLRTFLEEYPEAQGYVIGTDGLERSLDSKIRYCSWSLFLSRLVSAE